MGLIVARMDTVLRQYLDAERGRSKDLALALGIRQSAISQWDKVPAERVVAVEKATGIPREDLRPDLYEPAPKSAA